MQAVIDLMKGHHVRGKHTVHTNPDRCSIVLHVLHSQTVNLNTGINGVRNGQWILCRRCEALDDIIRPGIYKKKEGM